MSTGLPHSVVDNLHEGVWVTDKDNCTTFVNPRMAEMLGYTKDEMLGRHLFSFMDEQGVRAATRYLERCQQGIREEHDFEFLRKDGTRIYTALASSRQLDADQNYIGTIAGVLDVTERKRSEEALRESESKHRTLLEASFDLIYVIGRDDVVQYANPAALRAIGRPVQEVIGKSRAALFPKVTAARQKEELSRVLGQVLADKRKS